ncbi:beta-L-arabinofuranosidase domain-containing protein [Ructibacterium gallinarum]|uniref:Glycoside hydrolase family 127 protein n=1 Tax=Ructibacterium gallinarum TaxID=2779355 RepID=A0A9D5R7J7_9FIRM|nr:beta-L-arabinofuranosidase domain-containing protein [Ructibacterium gallinarum]MBE5039266.1 glycoside hydrolase family 127 protein [Ructibacterium gallinarum]
MMQKIAFGNEEQKMRKLDFFLRDDAKQCEYIGIIDEMIKYVESFQLLDTQLWKRLAQQFHEDADFDAGWRGEYWGKMMRGACMIYRYTQNQLLYNVLKHTVEDLLIHQEENGRISSYAVSHEFDGWDIWGRKYVLLGMQYFLSICKEEALSGRIMNSMCRQLDYIIQRIGKEEEGKRPITSATRHWRGLNSSSLLEPVVYLYSLTGKQEYFDFASYIVECGGTDVENIFRLAYEDKLYPYQYPVTKAYEMISCFEGLLAYYRVTGIEKYRTAIVNFANKILESDFTVIGSCGCTHELFDHSSVRQANTTNGKIAQETCVTVTLMKFFTQMTILTGDAKYADAVECSLYNAYMGAVNTEKVIEPSIRKEHSDWILEPLPFDSYSPLTAGTRGNGVGGLKEMSDHHYYGCCACIGAAGFGVVPLLQLLRNEKGFAISLFIDGTVRTKTPEGQQIVFETQTTYPKSGNIQIRLHMEREEQLEILVRNPGWSNETFFAVNGLPIETKKGYLSSRRIWHDGDVLEITFDMRTQAVFPVPYGNQVLMNKVIWGKNYMVPTYDEEDPLAHRHVALRRGPIMLAQENRLGYSVDDPVDIKIDEDGFIQTLEPVSQKAPYPDIIEAEIPLKDGGHLLVTDYASAGKLWNEESKMAVWMLTKDM